MASRAGTMVMLKFFRRVRDERADIETLQLRIKELQMSLLPSGIRYDTDKVQTSPTDQMLKVAAEVDALEREMQQKLTRLNADMLRAMQIVEAMPTARYRQLITLYYLTGSRTTWEQVANIMDYDVIYVKGVLRNAAIDEAREVSENIN